MMCLVIRVAPAHELHCTTNACVLCVIQRFSLSLRPSNTAQSISKRQKCIWHGIALAHKWHSENLCSILWNVFFLQKHFLLHALEDFFFFLSFFALHFHCFAVPGALFMLFFTIKHIFPVLCKIYSRDKHLRKVYLFFPPLSSLSLSRNTTPYPDELYTFSFVHF